jgi:hypothetical protein
MIIYSLICWEIRGSNNFIWSCKRYVIFCVSFRTNFIPTKICCLIVIPDNNVAYFRFNYRRGMDWMTGFIVITLNYKQYSATTNLHTSQFTTAPAKPFPACYVLTIRSLSVASNLGDSSAYRTQVLLTQLPMQNSLKSLNCQLWNSTIATEFNWLPTLKSVITSSALGPRYIA